MTPQLFAINPRTAEELVCLTLTAGVCVLIIVAVIATVGWLKGM